MIYNNIKSAREFRGLSQKYVAHSLGVSAPTVSEWESGRKKPSTENVIALSKLLSISTDCLLGLVSVPSEELVWNSEKLVTMRTTINAKPISVANRLGISLDQYNEYEKGSIAPNANDLINLALYFCCTVDHILGLEWSRNDIPYTDASFPPIIQSFGLLSEEGKTRLLEYADDLIKSGKYDPSKHAISEEKTG